MAFLTMEVSGRHARTRAITRDTFLLQIALVLTPKMRRETSRVSFLMCPFCVRPLLTHRTTDPGRPLTDRTLPDALGS